MFGQIQASTNQRKTFAREVHYGSCKIELPFAQPRNPCLCSVLGIGAGRILIAGGGGKLSASFSRKTSRSGYNIVICFPNQFLLRKDLRGKLQLSRLRNIEQFLRLLVRLQQRAFLSLNHKQ